MQHKKKINTRNSERCSDLPFLSLSVTHEAQVVRPKDNREKRKSEIKEQMKETSKNEAGNILISFATMPSTVAHRVIQSGGFHIG